MPAAVAAWSRFVLTQPTRPTRTPSPSPCQYPPTVTGNDEPSVDETVERMVRRLADRANAEPAAGFPRDRGLASHPGLYAWYASSPALDLLSAAFGERLDQPIYTGQAGASSARAGIERSATLLTRIRSNHLRGNLKASTFRRTLAAVLREPLGLQLDAPRVLSRPSKDVLTAWIAEHLEIVIAPFGDRSTLAAVEHDVLQLLDPPLNLDQMPPTPVRARLKALRAELANAP